MKVICIGRNYAAHAAELNNPVPAEPVIFCKPDTAVLKNNQPFYLPDFSQDVHHELEVVIRINRQGKYIAEEFAHKYYNQFTLGIDFTARDLQQKLKEKGQPWEKAKAFDNSAPLGTPVDLTPDIDVNNISFSLRKNGDVVQQGNTGDMLFNIDRIIAEVSKYFTLKVGDLIYTGTPSGVSAVKKGDLLEAFHNNHCLLSCEVK